MKHLIIYHAHCNDGFGAAWAVWKSLVAENEVELFAASYGKEPPYEKMNKSTTVHIVDFSYPVELFEKICEWSNWVYLLDHHKTAIEEYKLHGYENLMKNATIIFNTNKSGAMLAWEYYHTYAEVPRIIKHIQDRDLWKFELEGTKAVHVNLQTHPKDMDHWNQLIEFCEYPVNFSMFLSEGAAIQRYYDQLIQNILATNKVEVFIDGVRGLACNCPGALASDLGHILANESGTYGFTWEETNKGDEKCSLRSNGDYDISGIAKSFGGGGHKNAAGFTLELEDLSDRIRFKPL